MFIKFSYVPLTLRLRGVYFCYATSQKVKIFLTAEEWIVFDSL